MNRSLRTALWCALGFVGLYAVAVLTKPGQWADDRFFALAQAVAVGPSQQWLPVLARDVLPGAMAVVVLIGAIRAVATGRWGAVLACLPIVVVPVLLGPFLRDVVLWRPQFGYSYPENTLPSTHASAVVALTVAVAILWPRRPGWIDRGLLLVVGLALVGNVVDYAHRPSDVVASLLLVGAVAALTGWIVPRPSPTLRRDPAGTAPT
ncbi:phosphatase PAP2 family protein [Janibacter sp. G56]|uniref:phosphatase PAP2 family protein n=1 Tax=Janibacter sp. G56 TaxID=3418717 RepID=UPI003D067E53